MADYANQTFLYFLAFYVGAVTARQSGSAIDWFDYDEMLEVIPDNSSSSPVLRVVGHLRDPRQGLLRAARVDRGAALRGAPREERGVQCRDVHVSGAPDARVRAACRVA